MIVGVAITISMILETRRCRRRWTVSATGREPRSYQREHEAQEERRHKEQSHVQAEQTAGTERETERKRREVARVSFHSMPGYDRRIRRPAARLPPRLLHHRVVLPAPSARRRCDAILGTRVPRLGHPEIGGDPGRTGTTKSRPTPLVWRVNQQKATLTSYNFPCAAICM